MKKVIYFCDLCGEELNDSLEKEAKEFKIRMKPSGGWLYADVQPFLDLCPDCTKEIMEVLQRRYNIGHG